MLEVITKMVGSLVLLMITTAGLAMLFSWPVMFLWNWALVPAVTIVKPIGWLQAWGIMFLCGCLFKSRVKPAKPSN